MDYIIILDRLFYRHFLMRIKPLILILGDPRLGIASSLAEIQFHGVQRNKLQSLDQVQNLNTDH